MPSCGKCGASFTRKYNLERHQTSRCKGGMRMNTVSNETVAVAVRENNHQRTKNSQLSSFIDNIINKNPDGDENNMIQRFKSTSLGNGVENLGNEL